MLTEPESSWPAYSTLQKATQSRYGLQRIFCGFILLYLCFIAAYTILTLPAHTSLSSLAAHDAIASIILVGILCLHLVSALQRDAYTTVDVILDLCVAIVAAITLQSPLVASSLLYLILIVACCLLTLPTLLPLFVLCILASLLATCGLHHIYTVSPSEIARHMQLLCWQTFCLNIVGIPAVGFLFGGIMQLLRDRERELSMASHVKNQVVVSQNRLLIAEKMAALGRMSGTIAHEINNQLSAVVTSFDLMQAQIEMMRDAGGQQQSPIHSSDIVTENLLRWVRSGRKAVTQSVDFVQRITNQTRRLGQVNDTQFFPEKILTELSHLLVPVCAKDGCQLHLQCEDSSLMLYGDPGEFTQVILNLVKNAIDAYHGRDDNEEHPIWVTLSREHESVVVTVADAGCGIPAEIRSKVFDYLFTTKPGNRGSGLGLSIVHEIVTTHFGGIIDIHSRVDHGTTFILTFPKRDTSDISRELAII